MTQKEMQQLADCIASAMARQQEEVWTAEDVAKFLKVSPSFVNHNIDLYPSFMVGRKRRYLKSEIIKFISA